MIMLALPAVGPVQFVLTSRFVVALVCLSFVVQVADTLAFGAVMQRFMLLPMGFAPWPEHAQRLMTYAVTHKNWNHFYGNISNILLLGPVLEESLGSSVLAALSLCAVVCTGVLHSLFFSSIGLVGMSGVVFLFLTTASGLHMRADKPVKQVPISFVLVLVCFLGREVGQAFWGDDGISHFTHVAGVAVALAFLANKPKLLASRLPSGHM